MKNILSLDTPDDGTSHFRIVTETYATAIGPSATSVSTATTGDHYGYVDLDKWVIQNHP